MVIFEESIRFHEKLQTDLNRGRKNDSENNKKAVSDPICPKFYISAHCATHNNIKKPTNRIHSPPQKPATKANARRLHAPTPTPAHLPERQHGPTPTAHVLQLRRHDASQPG